MKCLFCKNNKNLLIKKHKYWTILLHPDQRYLGRSMVKLQRHIVDFFDTTEQEKAELFGIMKRLKGVLTDLFKPDLFNYASFGNEVRHLHIHLIPRYKNKRVFKGIEFIDERWGHNYSPYEKLKLSRLIFNKLREQIKQKLKYE